MSNDLAEFLADLPKFSAPARCAETDPDAFVPEPGGWDRRAKAVCLRCEVQAECLAYALTRGLNGGSDGMWGGATPRQRRVMRGRQGRVA